MQVEELKGRIVEIPVLHEGVVEHQILAVLFFPKVRRMTTRITLKL